MFRTSTWKHFVLLGIIFLLFEARAQDTGFGATSSSPDIPKVRYNRGGLNRALSKASKLDGLRSLLIAQHDKVVVEQYFEKYNSDSLDHVRSVTKSVLSTLIGIAVDKGYINSLDQPISDFLGHKVSRLVEEKQQITIYQLLTMSSGFKWDEMQNVEEYKNWIYAPDHLDYLFERPLITNPGEFFAYNSAASHLLSAIITEATGMSTYFFAHKYLFEPLGITRVRWEKVSGYYNGAAGMQLRPEDMMKIGILYLNDGEYDGKQVISRDWVKQATKRQIHIQNKTHYGYLWWVGDWHGVDFYLANGYGGQFIAVIPKLDLVVTASSQWRHLGENANDQWDEVLSLIFNDVVPAFRYHFLDPAY